MFERPPPRSRGAARCLALAAFALVLGCGSEAGRGEMFELADAEVFAGHDGVQRHRGFDLLATDMDADGDPDVLINWHHLLPLELYANEGGRFERVNAPDDDRSGIFDNPGVAALFVDAAVMLGRVAAAADAGLYVWHDVNRHGDWHLLWKGDAAHETAFVLELTTSLGFVAMAGERDGELEVVDQRTRRLAVDRGRDEFALRVKTEQATPRLHVSLRSRDGEPLPVFVGLDLTAHPEGEVELWKPDPHGIAWVDVEGSPRPELYITRGGLMGKLVAPSHPKLDAFFRPTDDGRLLYQRAAGVPRDRGRGRAVEWVDVDNDGSPELSVSNEQTPNKLLARDEGSGGFRDVAPELGLDLEGAEVLCWGDHDGDGWQDLYYLEDRVVHCLRNTGGGGFERLAGDSLGLVLPAASPPPDGGNGPSGQAAPQEPGGELFDFAALRLADADADGDLDLWVLMYGRERTNHLFLRAGERFADATDRAGLGAVRGNIFAVLCDVDDDGFEDAVSNGRLRGAKSRALLWHNRRGESFAISQLSAPAKDVHMGAALDADGDGRIDLALAGNERYLLRNITRKNSWFGVSLRDRGREPIGALVKAHYAGGRTVVRRVGSTHRSAYSQVLGPLRFGVPKGGAVERVTVRWPGDRQEQAYPPPELGTTVRIER